MIKTVELQYAEVFEGKLVGLTSDNKGFTTTKLTGWGHTFEGDKKIPIIRTQNNTYKLSIIPAYMNDIVLDDLTKLN